MKIEASADTAACNRIIGRLAVGSDVVVDGEVEAVRAVLAAAAVRLAAANGVVRVSAPPGGLSLSGLIAQLSGKGDLSEHDDSVLEAGVRRLAEATGAGRRAVMVLETSAGLHRSAFRFLRQLSRRVPDMVFLMAWFSDLPALLDEPGMEDLRRRLRAEPAMVVAPEAVALGEQLVVDTWTADDFADLPPPLVPAPPALNSGFEPVASGPTVVRIPPEWRTVSSAPARSRTPLLWAATGLGMAMSLAVGAWLGVSMAGSAQPLGPSAGQPASAVAEMVPARLASRRVGTQQHEAMEPPVVAAQVAAPTLARVPPPAVVSGMPPPLASRARADMAKMARPELATLAGPPSLAPAEFVEMPTALASRDILGSAEGIAREIAPALELPHEAVPGPTRPTLRQTRVPSEERRRAMSPHPQRFAVAPGSEIAPRRSMPRPTPQFLPSNEQQQASREQQSYPGESEGAETEWLPPARYRRWTPAQGWRGERSVPPAEGAYIGTYESGPYGSRVFRYDP